MSRRTTVYAVLATLAMALGLTLVAVPVPAASAATPVRIMPLGDSITAGPGCWRALVWDQLRRAGHTDIDFVGSASDGGSCNYGFSYDPDHEGHGGFSAVGIANNNQLPPWLAAADPDIVVMHLGTNDLWGGWQSMDTIMAAFTTLVGQMRAHNPDMKLLVAQIIPHHGCATCPADTVTLNSRIVGWAAGLTTTRSPIAVVDQWTGFDAATDTGDGVHPNDAGFRKMADRFAPAIARLLGTATPTPTPSTTGSPTPTPTVAPTTPPVTPTPTVAPTTPPAGGNCTAIYRVVSQWNGGFQGEVSVRNTGPTATSAWTTTLTLGGGQQINQAWNATVTQTGAVATAGNASWNGGLPAGGTASFGFLASGDGAAGVSATCVVS
ncbi:cellulose binding domain-containing protein [Solwaraspora sp. WMMD406]|uniref:cellulose binding domain-containing protein n=1 Tax=Solwaraspora sp. WMMD406 TaxID=3016095 RepID=UPI002416A7B9|nr:cellulose binding domain-containing protein [Solwaraspora sp. WMMD406]MDG4766672.1 cellulose binding domain-containing protein [Solwaraspora sp. WMMD406]